MRAGPAGSRGAAGPRGSTGAAGLEANRSCATSIAKARGIEHPGPISLPDFGALRPSHHRAMLYPPLLS